MLSTLLLLNNVVQAAPQRQIQDRELRSIMKHPVTLGSYNHFLERADEIIQNPSSNIKGIPEYLTESLPLLNKKDQSKALKIRVNKVLIKCARHNKNKKKPKLFQV